MWLGDSMSIAEPRGIYTQNPMPARIGDERTFNFKTQLEVSKEGEMAFIRWAEQKKQKGQILYCRDVREDERFQGLDIDFITLNPDGREKTWEIKTDTTDTGNLFAEFAVNTYQENGLGSVTQRYMKPGWLYGSSADRVFYYFTRRRMAYIFDLPQFAAWVDSRLMPAAAKQVAPFRVRAAKNVENRNDPSRYYYGIGYLVSLAELEQAEMMRGHQSKVRFADGR